MIKAYLIKLVPITKEDAKGFAMLVLLGIVACAIQVHNAHDRERLIAKERGYSSFANR